MITWLDEVQWTADGLVAAIAQDYQTCRVLMVAWMNRESLALSLEKGEAVYWSRSRGRLWRKGEESGHVQKIKSIALDCDGDAILLTIEQIGAIACHTGRESCFFRELKAGQWAEKDPVIKTPDMIYRKHGK